MSLNAREQQTLTRIAVEIAATAPELTALLAVFNKLEHGTEMPARLGQPGSHAGWSRDRRRAFFVAVVSLISVGVIAAVIVLALTGHRTGPGDNYPWLTNSRAQGGR